MVFILPDILRDLSWSHQFGKARHDLHIEMEDYFSGYNISIVSKNDQMVFPEMLEKRITHWVTLGFNLIIGCSFSYEDGMIQSSLRYPNVSMIHISGNRTVGHDNFAQVDAFMFQPQYIIGYAAGKMTKTNKICYLKSWDQNIVRRWYNAYALGAKKANPEVQITVMHINTWVNNENKEIAQGAVRALATHDCDIISGTLNEDDLYVEARKYDLLSTGYQADWATYIGESVIISTMFSATNILRPYVFEAVVNGSFAHIERHQWMGMDTGMCDVSQLSVWVPLPIRDEVAALRREFLNGDKKVFCGEIRDTEGIVRVPNGTCINETTSDLQSNDMRWHLEGTNNLGLYQLPETTCPLGTYYTYDPLINQLICHLCPAGTYSAIPMEGACVPCRKNYRSSAGAKRCQVCPKGFYSQEGSSICIAPSNWWLFLIVILSILLLMILCLFGMLLGVYHLRRCHHVRKAPKKGRVTIVFSDLEESTELANSLGNIMKVAHGIHNKVVTKNLKKFDGYMVKSLGDGFMLAFSSCAKAVLFCTATQKELLHQNWPKELLEHPLCKEEYDEETKQLTYRGLRVRMGIKSGYPQIIHNRFLSTYDYIGNYIAIASRCEAAGYGGYILLTADEVREVASTLNHLLFHKECLMKFKGVTEPVQVYSVWERPLDLRRVRRLQSSEKATVYAEGGTNTDDITSRLQLGRQASSLLPLLRRSRAPFYSFFQNSAFPRRCRNEGVGLGFRARNFGHFSSPSLSQSPVQSSTVCDFHRGVLNTAPPAKCSDDRVKSGSDERQSDSETI